VVSWKWPLEICVCRAFQLLVLVPDLREHRLSSRPPFFSFSFFPFLPQLAHHSSTNSDMLSHTPSSTSTPFFSPKSMASTIDFEQQFRELDTLFTQGRHSECVRQAKHNLLNNGFQHCATPMPPTLRIKTICIIVRSETD
jgi:hypothetical protein